MKSIKRVAHTNHTTGYCYHCEEPKNDINHSYCCKGCEDAENKFNQST